MKKILAFIVFVMASHLSFAQYANYLEVSREVMKTEKKAIVAEVMQLQDDQAAIFWPLYNEFQEQLFAVNTKDFAVIKDFADNFDNLSNEKAVELVSQVFKNDQELLKVRKTYFKKMQKVLPGTLVLRYFQVENKIEALVNAELASEIPFLEKLEN